MNGHLQTESLANLCRRYHVRELSLFGSAARDEMLAESDLDLMVEFERGARIGIVKFASFAYELELMADRKVDLVTTRGLKPWTRPNILRDARVLYAA